MKTDEKKPNARHYPGAPIHADGQAGPWRDALSGDHPQRAAAVQRYHSLFFGLLGWLFILLAFCFDTPLDIWHGMLKIFTSSANLLTDYMALANAGAALVNVGLMTHVSILILRLNKLPVSGSIVAAVFTMIGFSFFGKNLFNTMPIILGVYLYAASTRQPFGEYVLHSMFGTALSPLVSEVSFNLGIPFPFGVLLGIAGGLAAGFAIAPLSMWFLQFHKGLTLYNIGFTAGIIGMFFMAVLRGFNIDVYGVSILSEGHNLPFSILLYSIFAVLLVLGLRVNHWRFKGYGSLLRLRAHCRRIFWQAAVLVSR